MCWGHRIFFCIICFQANHWWCRGSRPPQDILDCLSKVHRQSPDQHSMPGNITVNIPHPEWKKCQIKRLLSAKWCKFKNIVEKLISDNMWCGPGSTLSDIAVRIWIFRAKHRHDPWLWVPIGTGSSFSDVTACIPGSIPIGICGWFLAITAIRILNQHVFVVMLDILIMIIVVRFSLILIDVFIRVPALTHRQPMNSAHLLKFHHNFWILQLFDKFHGALIQFPNMTRKEFRKIVPGMSEMSNVL